MSATAEQGSGLRLQRVALVAAMALASINIWTGAPLAAVWVGSKVAASQDGLSMLSLFLVVVILLTLSISLALLVGRLSARYDEVTGTTPQKREHASWLRAMSGERRDGPGVVARLKPVEYVVVGTVILCLLAFEVWFFFFSGASI